MHLQSVEHICHHFWIGATANPPKSDDKYAQLTRGAFIINDFLRNPHFSEPRIKQVRLISNQSTALTLFDLLTTHKFLITPLIGPSILPEVNIWSKMTKILLINRIQSFPYLYFLKQVLFNIWDEGFTQKCTEISQKITMYTNKDYRTKSLV